ncbi:sensor histidine kinase [Verrucomicrobiota bacterium sgz303538]
MLRPQELGVDLRVRDLQMEASDHFALTLTRKSHKVANALAVVLGALVLVGWAFGLELLYSPMPRFGRMSVPAACSILLASLSLWLWRVPFPKSRMRVAQACGLVVAGIGFLGIIKCILDWNVGVPASAFDAAWVPGATGPRYRMAFNTALSLSLVGLSLCLLDAQTRRGKSPAEWLALTSAFMPFAALVGYIYDVDGLIRPFPTPFAPADMSLPTTVALLALCIAVLTARPERGGMARFTSNSPEGVVARSLLPSGTVILLLQGWLVKSGEQAGFYDIDQAAAILVASSALTLGVLVRHSLKALARLESDRQKAEKDLHKSEERLRMALAAANVGTWEWDIETNRVRWTEAVEDIFGVPRGSFDERGESFLQFVHPDDRELVITRAWRAVEGGDGHYQAEYRILWPDGSVHWVVSRGEVFRDENGKPIRIAGTTVDITERKLLERELIEASNREQRRLGQDLHDDLGQWLTGILLQTHAFAMSLRSRSEADAVQADRIAEHIRESINRTRMLARGMAPAAIEADGLAAALEELAGNVGQMSRTECRCICSGELKVGNPETALHLYRIAQESINNAIRHGEATDVVVVLEPESEGRARLTVRDNGKGIVPVLQKACGMGLRIMRYRASLIGADFDIHPAEVGTEVICSFPKEL